MSLTRIKRGGSEVRSARRSPRVGVSERRRMHPSRQRHLTASLREVRGLISLTCRKERKSL